MNKALLLHTKQLKIYFSPENESLISIKIHDDKQYIILNIYLYKDTIFDLSKMFTQRLIHQLKELSIRNCNLDSNFMDHLLKEFKNLPLLEYLDLSDNNFRNYDIIYLLKKLYQEKNNLKILKFYKQNLTEEIILDVANIFRNPSKLIYINSLNEQKIQCLDEIYEKDYVNSKNFNLYSIHWIKDRFSDILLNQHLNFRNLDLKTFQCILNFKDLQVRFFHLIENELSTNDEFLTKMNNFKGVIVLCILDNLSNNNLLQFTNTLLIKSEYLTTLEVIRQIDIQLLLKHVKCPNLRRLVLNTIQIKDNNSFMIFHTFFVCLKGLEEFIMIECNINIKDKEIFSGVDAIEFFCRNLVILEFISCEVSTFIRKYFYKLILLQSNLLYLSFGFLSFNDDTRISLFDIKHYENFISKKLTSLTLSDFEFSNELNENFFGFVSHLTSLKYICLIQIDFTGIPKSELISFIQNISFSRKSITHFELDSCKLDTKVAIHLGKLISSFKFIQEIVLRGLNLSNNIGMELFKELLKEKKNISLLFFIRCKFSADMGVFVGKFVEESLIPVVLAFNEINFLNKVGEKIFQNIKKASSIKSLELTNCKSTNDICKLIGQVIGSQNQLVRLIIDGQIHKDNIMIFQNIPEECDTLREVTIIGFHFSEELKIAVKDFLKRQKYLLALTLAFTNLKDLDLKEVNVRQTNFIN